MSLKDALEIDISNVFFNSDEFGETANINGKEMNVIIDNHELLRQKLSKGEKLTKAELLFHVAQKTFGNVPKPNVHLDFNNKRYLILDIANNTGVLTITLERYSG